MFDDFGDSALAFEAYFWCDVGGEKMLREIRGEIRIRLTEFFESNGIVIAYPQTDVHLDAQKPVPVRIVQDEVER